MISTYAAKSNSPFCIFKTAIWKREEREKNWSFFDPDGLMCFTGPQGSGKTLAAVQYVKKLMELYPRCKLVTNIVISGYEPVSFSDWLTSRKGAGKQALHTFKDWPEDYKRRWFTAYKALNRVFWFENADDLKRYKNLDEGTIYLIDEVQLYLNSLESKSVSLEVMAEISQQRKQRCHIVCTSQVWGRLAKPLREQFSCAAVCRCFFGLVTRIQYVKQEDLDTDDAVTAIHGKVYHTQWLFHTPSMYQCYDTYAKIERGNFINKGEIDIYDRNN